MLSRVITLLFIMSCWACGPDEDRQSNSTETLTADQQGHQRMVDTLASIARNAEPQKLYNLNRQRAAGIKLQLDAATDQNQQIQFTYLYATELLNSGQIDESLAVLGSMLDRMPLQENLKPFFDLQALAYLRLGEVTNCRENHTAESCILPIREGGVHQDKSGSGQAIESYTKILYAFPNDQQSRYLLNLAYQTLGKTAADVPAQWRIPQIFSNSVTERTFADVASHHSGEHMHHSHNGLAVNELSGGVAIADFNGDGMLDVFATSYGLSHEARLFLGDGKLGFAQAEAGLSGIFGGLNCQAADYDNDGDTDVLVLRGGWFGAAGAHPNSLLRNDGKGHFTDVTFAAGLAAGRPTQTAVWSDLDLDGDLDLFIGNEASNDARFLSEIYLNDGAGRFSESGKEVGIQLIGVVKGVTAGDVNGDGLPDLYASCLGQPNQLYINQGVSGGLPRFVQAPNAGVAEPTFSFPTWMFDYDQDGDLDIFAAGYDTKQQGNVAGIEAAIRLGQPTTAAQIHLFENQGDGTFKDASQAAGIARPAHVMGSNFGDLDGNGYPDMYLGTGSPDLRSVVPNLLYLNSGQGRFRENTFESGLGHVQKGHGIGMADFDRDGDLDIYTVLGGAFEGDNFPNALFENKRERTDYISIQLDGTHANKQGLGAQVQAFAKTQNQSIIRYATLSTGGSFGGNAPEIYFGFPAGSSVDSIVVHWPSRTLPTTVINTVSLNQRITIKQE